MNYVEPSAPAPTRRPGRTTATRKKLFDASMLLIGERGPAHVTVDEIAAAAGVSKGTVYYNFGSKSDLVAQLLEYGVDLLEERLVPDDSVPPLEALKVTLGYTLDFFQEYPSFSQLIISELWRSPSEWHSTLALLRERLFSIAGQAIRRAVEGHEVETDIDEQALVGLMMGSALVLALDRQVFHPERSRDEAIRVLMLPLRGYVRDVDVLTL
ncbi:TetR/AcrR family transcriptional regulator [Haematomicrobium sanguinis]|uniref:TetR/AcrR family transcriptional regulator n=1 Tax=Haematomicrobium sanguinis TaxID=479106 RepID=UPI00047C6804|nr:TetR/AcrR family transcriptional regulator [Haematomicrobium sanguinis]